jgi:hypothetical protein
VAIIGWGHAARTTHHGVPTRVHLLATARHLKAGTDAGVALARTTISLDGRVSGTIGLDDLRGSPAPAPVRRTEDDPLWMEGWAQSEAGPLSFRFRTRKAVADGDATYPAPVKTRLRGVDPDTFRRLPWGRPGLVPARTAARHLDYVGESERRRTKLYGFGGKWWSAGDVGVLRRNGSVELLDREVDRWPGRTEDVVEDRLVLRGRPAAAVVVTGDGGGRWVPDLPEPVVRAWRDVPRTGKVRQLTGSVRNGRWT